MTIRPYLPKSSRLQYDRHRQTWHLLVPERILRLDPIAADVLSRCDGRLTLEAIASELASEYQAEPSVIVDDLFRLFQPLLETQAVKTEDSSPPQAATGGSSLERSASALGWKGGRSPSLGVKGRRSPLAGGGQSPPRSSQTAFETLAGSRLESSCDRPLGMLCELTHRCPLQCPYCSNPLALEGRGAELKTAQWQDLLRQAAALGVLQIHLSGGEPTLREDLETLVETAIEEGLYPNLITAGVTLSRKRFERLVERGLPHVQLSIQDTDEASADQIAQYKGSLAKKLEVAQWVKDAGIALTLNVPLHRLNLRRVGAMIDLALSCGAERLELAHVQWYGWARRNLARLRPSWDEVEACIHEVEASRERHKGRLVIDLVTPDLYAVFPKPCMGGWGRSRFCVTPSGRILPCHAAGSLPDLHFETIQERSLAEIWFHSPAFQAYRGSEWMQEPCRSCPRKEVDFGGCRCQAFEATGQAKATDPACSLSADHARWLASHTSEPPPPALVYRRLP